MGSRGPKPLPSAIKQARGTFRADRAAGNEAQSIGVPKFLIDVAVKDARKEFNRLSKLLLTMGLVGAADSNVLTRYCLAWVRWRRIVQTLASQPAAEVAVLKDADGNVKDIRVSALHNVAKSLADELGRIENAMGMTPSARSRIEVSMTAAPTANEPMSKSRFFDSQN